MALDESSTANMSDNPTDNNEDEDTVVTMIDVLQEEADFEDNANAVLGASDDKNCTYPKGYIKRQALYACLTCIPDSKTEPNKRAGVCLACSLNCHENHDLIELYTKRNFRCDCGNPNFPQPCQFSPERRDFNTENKYNQNFSGIYCICQRPYPDPESTIDDDEEMIQCVICEDWLHATHLNALVPNNDQYSEMICKSCMDKNEFLYDYSDFSVVPDSEVDVSGFENSDVTQNGDYIMNDIDSGKINIDTQKETESTVTNAVDKSIQNNCTKEPEENNLKMDTAENISISVSDENTQIVKQITNNEEDKNLNENSEIENNDIDMEENQSEISEQHSSNLGVSSTDKHEDKNAELEDMQSKMSEQNTSNLDVSSAAKNKDEIADLEAKQSEISEKCDSNIGVSSTDNDDTEVFESKKNQTEISEPCDPNVSVSNTGINENEVSKKLEELENIITSDDNEKQLNEKRSAIQTITYAAKEEKSENLSIEEEEMLLSDDQDSINFKNKTLLKSTMSKDVSNDCDTVINENVMNENVEPDPKLGEMAGLDDCNLQQQNDAAKENEDTKQEEKMETELDLKPVENVFSDSNEIDDKGNEKQVENVPSDSNEIVDKTNEKQVKNVSPDSNEIDDKTNGKQVENVPSDSNEHDDKTIDGQNEILMESSKMEETSINADVSCNKVFDAEKHDIMTSEKETKLNGVTTVENTETENTKYNDIETSEENSKNNDSSIIIGKRKLLDDENIPDIKRAKSNEVVDKNCLKPKNVKKRFKGATFWPCSWRKQLCSCYECVSMYKSHDVLFLLDLEDTVSAYEALGEAQNGKKQSQYEKGLQALSSLDRTQQINALTEYNKMKDKLIDFLKSFKDRQRIVKEEDIKNFFAGMKPRREPDGVYFCR